MKRCPRCDKNYPDSETFCESDGTALISGGPAFVAGDAPPLDAGPQLECPVCGGKAQPGELICNFCGARLGIEPAEAPYTPAPPAPEASRTSGVQPGRSPSTRITGKMAEDENEEEAPRRGPLTVIGYVLAAVIALGGGAWLALHLSSGSGGQPVAQASKSAIASPAAAISSVPSVALAAAMGVQVMGDSATAPERSQEAARKIFESNKNSLLDPYTRALAGESSTRDAMVVRLRVLPNGSVDAASVRTSTNPNPVLDAEVVTAVSSWNFAPFSGGQVEVDYPVIFTNDPSSKDALEAQLKTKLAGLSPSEAPEFASAPAASPSSSEAAGVASPVPTAAEATPAEAAAAVAPAPKRRPRREVARPAPTPTLQQQVKQVLASNPKLRRVDCYTSGGTVTIFGKVFDANDKQLAERVVGRVPGVTNVVDSLSTDESDWAARQNKIAQQLANGGLNNVTVKVIGHDAYLGGTVKSEADKQRAATIAESAAPVHVRTNLITVELGNMFGF
jgi:TonB family protein